MIERGKKIKYKELLERIAQKERELLELDDVDKKNWLVEILESLVENKEAKKLRKKEERKK